MSQNTKGDPWYGKQGNSVLCPVPGCGHVGSFISKIHCRLEHGIEREEVGEKYGYPKSMGNRWNIVGNGG